MEKYVKLMKRYCELNYQGVSPHIINIGVSIMMHRDDVIYGGGFVTAVCENDLSKVVSRADSECINHLELFVNVRDYLYLESDFTY